MTVDLHLHTHHSDGSWSPTQVVAEAKRLKFRVIAITDHDTTAGLEEANQAGGSEIEIIPGIEINTVMRNSADADIDIHILGYLIQPHHPSLRAIIERQQKARFQLVDDTVNKLNQLGFALTHEIIREFAGNGSIGRPHITRAIVKVGGAANVNDAYARFMSRTSPDYIARHSVSPEEAIEAINEAGGIASIAHPGKDKSMDDIIVCLKGAGLKAIEAYHRSHSQQTARHYLKLAAKQMMAVTGGSDCHGPTDGYPASIGSVRLPLHVVQDLRARTS